MITKVEWNRVYRALRWVEVMRKNNPGSFTAIHERTGIGREKNRVICQDLVTHGYVGEIPLVANRRYLKLTQKGNRLYEAYEQFLEAVNDII